MDLKYLKAPLTLKADAEGAVQALFSVFNMRDSDGDVVLPSFFQDGQEIPMAAWGHDWGSLPPGKGVIRVTPEGALFDGRFFLDTTPGKDHYATVKAMGPLQEWSFGFKVIESKRGEFEGKPTRFLVKGETYEASPVLVGANRETRTVSVKGAHRKNYYGGLEAPEGSFEDLAEDLAEAFVAGGNARPDDSVRTVATFPNGVAYLAVCDYGWGEPVYWRVEYDLGADGDPIITAVAEVEASIAFAPDDDQPAAITYAGQATRALAAVRGLTAVRLKEGRTFSAANVTRLQSIMQSCRNAMDEMEQLLGDAAAPKAAAGAELRRAYLATEQRFAELTGVA